MPRRGASLALVAALASSWSLHACDRRRADPSPSGSAVAAPAPVAPVTPAVPAPPAVERDPDRPPWVDDRVLGAPFSSDVEREFEAARDRSTPLASGLVLCRAAVSTEHAWDTSVVPFVTVGLVDHTAPDVNIYFRVGDGPERVSPWQDDRSVAFGAFPAVSVRPGVSITLRLVDRDVLVLPTGPDAIGTATAVWSGTWPLAFRGEHFTAECRATTTEAALARAQPALGEFDREAALLARSRERPSARSIAELYPSARFARGRAALCASAAWVGWSHPEVRERVATSSQLDARMIETLTQALGRAGGAPMGSPQRIAVGTVTLERWRCDEVFARSLDPARPPTCAAVFEVTVRPGAAELDGDVAIVTLHAPFDHPLSLSRCRSSSDGGSTWRPQCSARAGETVIFAYTTDQTVPAPRDPWTLPAVVELRTFLGNETSRFRVAP